MANGEEVNGRAVETSWMSDVQRALALILVCTFALALVVLTIRITIWGDPLTIVDLLKTLISALINVVMLVLGYFYGSSKAKETSDTSQQKVIEKLTGAPSPPGAGGPVAPVPQPTVVVAWWSLLTDTEKVAIDAAAKTDAKIQTILSHFVSGKAEVPDLTALVAAGLLTQERANAIQAIQ